MKRLTRLQANDGPLTSILEAGYRRMDRTVERRPRLATRLMKLRSHVTDRIALPAALVAFLATHPSRLIAQAADTARADVSGHVVDRASRAGLAHATIEIGDGAARVTSDSTGRFVLVGLTTGTHSVSVRRIGFDEFRTEWRLQPGLNTLTIALGSRPVVLEGVTVVGYRYSEDLRQRRMGTGVSSQAVERDRLQLSSARDGREAALMLGGLFRVGCPPALDVDDCILVRGRAIAPEVIIDERPAVGGLTELEVFSPGDLYLIEVYSGGRQIRAYTTSFIESEGQRARRPPPLFLR